METGSRKTGIVAGLVLAVLLGMVLLVHLDTSGIWDSNEAFYTETPREMMMEGGSLIIPACNGQFRMNKPPLAYWVVIAAYRLLGVSILAQRLCGVIFTAGLLVCVWQLAGLFLRDWRWRWLAVLITALTPRIYVMSRRGLIEIMVSFFLAAAFFFFLRWWREGRRRDLVFLYLSLGLGFLTKGPVVWVLAGGVLGLWIWWQHFRRQWPAAGIPVAAGGPPRPARPWYRAGWRRGVTEWWISLRGSVATLRRMHPLMGGSLLAVTVLPWYLAIWWLLDFDFVLRFFYHENFQRFTGGDFGPQRGVLYYPGILLGDFFPWVFLLPLAVWTGWQGWRSRENNRNAWQLFLLIWFFVPVLFFSLSSNKQEYYIMPSYPAAALLIATGLHQYLRHRRSGRFALVSLSIASGGMGLMGPALGFLLVRALKMNTGGWLFALIMITAAVASFRELHRRRYARAAGWLAGGMLGALLFVSMVVVPRLENFRPVKVLADRLEKLAGPEDGIGYCGYAAPSLSFYLRRHILEPASTNEFHHLFGQPWPRYFLVPRHMLPGLTEAGLPFHLIDERPLLNTRLKDLLREDVGGRTQTLCLIVNEAGRNRRPGKAEKTD